MELHELFEDIESPEFRSRFMIFSGFRLVRKALSRDPKVLSLINEMRLQPSIAHVVAKRISLLYAKHIDDAGSAFDIAVAAYLYCLYKTDQHFASRMSVYVLKQGKLWWSVDLALHIKKNMEMFTDLSKWRFKFYGVPTPTANTSWGVHVQPMNMKENAAYMVYGDKLCNISGRFSVRSPQLTQTQMLSA